MFDFETQGGATFGYSVDFTNDTYANISFFDDSQINIPFHLSLRLQAGLAVFNRRIGSKWQAEEALDVSFKPGANLVELRFAPPQTTVLLNGAVIFDLDETRAPKTETIIGLTYQGAISPASFKLGGARYQGPQGRGVLDFNGAFSVSGWGFVPEAPEALHQLHIAGHAAPLRPIAQANPQIAREEGALTPDIGVQAALPGRLWLGLAEDAALKVSLYCNGIPCGARVQLTRKEAVARIEAIAANPQHRDNTFLNLLTLEHIRYGNFLTGLSDAAQAWAVETAGRYGLTEFLQTKAARITPPQPHEPAEISLDQQLIETMRTSFTQAMTAAGDGADLISLLPELPPRGSLARRDSYLVLAEVFCAKDQFEALYARAAVDGQNNFAPANHGWYNSAILPFLYTQHRFDELREVLGKLAQPQPDWIVTSTLAWVMQQLAKAPPPQLSELHREALVQPFLDFLNNRGPLYWDRTHCQHLVQAMVALLSAKGLFSDHFCLWNLGRTALRVYGLSRQFWDQIDRQEARGDLHLGGDLAQARQSYRRIANHLSHPAPPKDLARRADIAQALRFFEGHNAPEARRFRVELLEGRALPAAAGDRLAALYDAPKDPARSAMRHLAFPQDRPGTEPADTDPPDTADLAIADLARRAVQASYPALVHAPYAALQSDVSRRMLAGLAALATQPKADFPDFPRLMQDLRSLSRERSHAVGLAMALVLMNALLQQGATAAAKPLLGEIAAMRAALSPEELQALPNSPAVVSALFSLRNGDRAEPNPMRKTLLQYFPNVTAILPPPCPSPTPAFAQDQSPLFDTLVTVISCRPYLDHRIAPLKAAWANRLKALGIPYVIVVGGAEGPARLEDDVLTLATPDDYEGLPQKVLATIDWVCKETNFAHMLKIDDDCFLDVEAFFHTQNWRKFAYYGRRLTRAAGQLDRTWHFAKSSSPRGLYELDKSPELSSYADGGSGYMLNRSAMTAVLTQAATIPGQQLLQNSFMEDKVIGDLLAMAQIQIADEGYFTAVQRRLHSKALPVSIWANSFWPSKASGVQLAHLDSAKAQPLAAAHRDSLTLFPHKIWPSYDDPRLGDNSNLLELVSPVAKLEQINSADLAVVACTRNEITMLPQFLAHYRKLGVTAFLIADNLSDDGSLEYLAEQPDVALFSVDSEYRHSQYGVAWQQAILSNLRLGRWSLVADIDELLITGTDPATAPSMDDIIAEATAEGADALRIFMLDLYPKGPLSEADMAKGDAFALAEYCDAEPFLTNCPSNGPYGNARTWTSALRHRLIPDSRAELFVAQKIALIRYLPWMRLSAGMHYIADAKLANRELIFGHFKYHAEFRKKALAEVNRGQHFNDAAEYRRYLALMSEGREVIYDPAVSVPWQSSAAVQRILAPKGAEKPAGKTGFAAKLLAKKA